MINTNELRNIGRELTDMYGESMEVKDLAHKMISAANEIDELRKTISCLLEKQ